MEIRKLQKIVVSALEDIKGKEIEVINTSKLTSMFDYVVIATGDSNRQVKALARNVHEKVREAGGEVLSIEGEDGGEWVLVDLGDIVVHVMQPNVRPVLQPRRTLARRRRPSAARRWSRQPANEAERARRWPSPARVG
jgi:ribosome-associated protein